MEELSPTVAGGKLAKCFGEINFFYQNLKSAILNITMRGR